jgi:5-methyltetrahydropteroyltriglutamate--homocysteine methyltransferase
MTTPSPLTTANLGFPRMGDRRQLKRALERHWRGDDPDGRELTASARDLRAGHWRLQADHGIDRIPSNDFSLYDHMLDTTLMVGAVPGRFGGEPFDPSTAEADALQRYFALARGAAVDGTDCVPLELTKWFDTNYHYLVPELAPDQTFAYGSRQAVRHWREAFALGIVTRPVLVGPVTFCRLSKRTDGGDPLELIDQVVAVYQEVLADLAGAGATAVQLDEPLLVTDLDAPAVDAYRRSYPALRAAVPGVELTLASYFGTLGPNSALALELPVDVVHLDLVRGHGQLDQLLDQVPEEFGLSLGVVDGRNVWRTDLGAILPVVSSVVGRLGPERVQLAPSCSLLHLPVDLAHETELDDELRSWLAFAVQRLEEIRILERALTGDRPAVAGEGPKRNYLGDYRAVDLRVPHSKGPGSFFPDPELDDNARAAQARRSSSRVHRDDVAERLASRTPDMAGRSSSYPVRRLAQERALGLPRLPTTTIGSFPQTAAVRAVRRRYRSGEIDAKAYTRALEAETEACVREQERLGLDVLVHGELERTDMVEYFGEQLDGFATTTNGWVQSYGSRCVKPPVLYGDVRRPQPMTLRWSTFAAGLTDRPMKGMLTGPVTILQWSFVRDDQPLATTCRQIGLALRDEVSDLGDAGLGIVQIDEPALREGLPLRAAERAQYLEWAVDAFRLASSSVPDQVQIHTHMCYAEFGDIAEAIVALDADVISMEASRSDMALLDDLAARGYPNEIGPGLWDVHSPRVPSEDELDRLVHRAISVFGAERLWVNPDCGLKTRDWPEVRLALGRLVAAAHKARLALEEPGPLST